MHLRAEVLRLRLNGLTYQSIGKTLHVSRQYAQQLTSPPKAIRDRVINLAHSKCEKCQVHIGSNGQVHHKKAKNLEEEVYNDLENLQLLCLACHRRSHLLPLPHTNVPMISNAMRAFGWLFCKRCGHHWLPRSPQLPTRCPACQSPYWNRARRVKAVGPHNGGRMKNVVAGLALVSLLLGQSGICDLPVWTVYVPWLPLTHHVPPRAFY